MCLLLFPISICSSAEHGIQTVIYCATEENLSEQSGFYYSDCAVQLTSENGSNMDDAYRLWELSERMAGLTSWWWSQIQILYLSIKLSSLIFKTQTYLCVFRWKNSHCGKTDFFFHFLPFRKICHSVQDLLAKSSPRT